MSFSVMQMNTTQHDSLDDEEDDDLASSMVYTHQLFYIKISNVFFV
jgi:hypothetical protein